MPPAIEHADCIIVGAGISGIGAAICFLKQYPEKSVIILDAASSLGGTWATFTYPGVRSDSDMYSFAYSFRPWTSTKVYADGATILQYLQETADEYNVTRLVRLQHKVTHARFSKQTAAWRLEMAGSQPDMTCSFLFMGVGYYNHAHGHLPTWPGQADFTGQLVHPQQWPRGLDVTGKRVLVIGSGATAISLMPALASKAAQVLWVQRTPTDVVPRPAVDPFANIFLGLQSFFNTFLWPFGPNTIINWIIRIKWVLISVFGFAISKKYPKKARRAILRENPLPKELKEKHFNPPYGVWDQRVCVAVDGDIFKCIQNGSVKVWTCAGGVHSFSEKGLHLSDGGHKGEFLAADVIVAATGLELLFMGGMKMFVDGTEVDSKECVINRGCFLSSVPNMAFLFGYTNASWSLRLDLTMSYTFRVLQRMQQLDKKYFVAVFAESTNGGTKDVAELLDFSSGYIQRGKNMFPKQGMLHPWRLSQNVIEGYKTAFWSDKEDESIVFC